MGELTKFRRKRNHDETVFDHGGNVDVQATIEDRADCLPRNPPPEKGESEISCKTICRRAASELVDCGSWKTLGVMLFYIDSANSGSGNIWASEATVVRKVPGLKNTKSVTRAHRFWRFRGYKVNGEVMPFLVRVRRGHIKPDGRKVSNAFTIGWLPLLALARDLHWCRELRAAAHAILKRYEHEKTDVSFG